MEMDEQLGVTPEPRLRSSSPSTSARPPSDRSLALGPMHQGFARSETERQPEEFARMRLECIRWESAAVESRAAEEDAKYQTQLKELEVQALRERLSVLDPVLVEERNRALRLKIQELQEEILELKEGKYEEAARLQDHSFQIRVHMEAEFRRKVRENEARVTEQLRAELPLEAQQALVDREHLRKELTKLQESIGAVTSRSRQAESQQKQLSVSESVSRSLASEQAKAAIHLRKRCEAAEAKQLEAEQKLAEALRVVEQLRSDSNLRVDSNPRLDGTIERKNELGSGSEVPGASESSGPHCQHRENARAECEALQPRGLNLRSTESRSIHVGDSRVRPSSAHPRLQKTEGRSNDRTRGGGGGTGTSGRTHAVRGAKRTEQAAGRGGGVDVAVTLVEVQQSEAKWRRRALILQESNARLEATLQQTRETASARSDVLEGHTKQTRERPKTARPISGPFS